MSLSDRAPRRSRRSTLPAANPAAAWFAPLPAPLPARIFPAGRGPSLADFDFAADLDSAAEVAAIAPPQIPVQSAAKRSSPAPNPCGVAFQSFSLFLSLSN